MGDAAASVLSAFLTIRIKLQLVMLENTTGDSDKTLNITMTVAIGFISFEYKPLD